MASGAPLVGLINQAGPPQVIEVVEMRLDGIIQETNVGRSSSSTRVHLLSGTLAGEPVRIRLSDYSNDTNEIGQTFSISFAKGPIGVWYLK